MITIYGHPRCVYCVKAKELSEKHHLTYEWKNTDEKENLMNLKTILPNVKTVPQIWWNKRHIGGYSEFAEEVENTIGKYGEQKI